MARAEKTIHYIYKTTCSITGRWYIGMHSTHNLDDGYMGSGKRLRYSIRKYGVDNHKKEILEFFDTRELLIEAEIKAITEDMVLDNNCMNLKGGGTGGFINEEHMKKAQKSGGESYKNKLKTDATFKEQHINKINNIWKNPILREKILKNLKNNWVGQIHSNETKQKISKTKKGTGLGENNSQYGTCWITKDGVNKKIKKEDLDSYLNEGWVKGRK